MMIEEKFSDSNLHLVVCEERIVSELTTHGFAKLALLPAAAELFDPTEAFICCSVGVTEGVGVGVGTGVWDTRMKFGI